MSRFLRVPDFSVVEAVQWTGAASDELAAFLEVASIPRGDVERDAGLLMITLSGDRPVVYAMAGSWLVFDRGEISSISNELFADYHRPLDPYSVFPKVIQLERFGSAVELKIDGELFPWTVLEAPEVFALDPASVPYIKILIPADRIEMIGRSGR